MRKFLLLFLLLVWCLASHAQTTVIVGTLPSYSTGTYTLQGNGQNLSGSISSTGVLSKQVPSFGSYLLSITAASGSALYPLNLTVNTLGSPFLNITQQLSLAALQASAPASGTSGTTTAGVTSIAIGSVSTSGTTGSVTNSGTAANPVWNFVFPAQGQSQSAGSSTNPTGAASLSTLTVSGSTAEQSSNNCSFYAAASQLGIGTCTPNKLGQTGLGGSNLMVQGANNARVMMVAAGQAEMHWWNTNVGTNLAEWSAFVDASGNWNLWANSDNFQLHNVAITCAHTGVCTLPNSNLSSAAAPSASLVVQRSGSAAQTITSAGQKLLFDTVVTDSANGWSAANNTYTIPTTGTYLITSSYSWPNNTTAGINYGQSVDTAIQSSSALRWFTTEAAPNSAAARQGSINTRIAHFAAGTVLLMFATVDYTSGLPAGQAELDIALLNTQ